MVGIGIEDGMWEEVFSATSSWSVADLYSVDWEECGRFSISLCMNLPSTERVRPSRSVSLTMPGSSCGLWGAQRLIWDLLEAKLGLWPFALSCGTAGYSCWKPWEAINGPVRRSSPSCTRDGGFQQAALIQMSRSALDYQLRTQ